MTDYAKILQFAEDFKNRFKNCSCCAGEECLANSWKKAFLIILLGDNIGDEIDREKALQLAIVQDLAECIDSENMECEKEKAKRKALKAFVRENLEDDTIYQLYKELHKNETLEAQFVNSLNENFEGSEPFWMKKEEEEMEEESEDEDCEEDEDHEEEDEEEDCGCDCGCEEEESEDDSKEDMGLVYEYLNKIADVLKIDFKKKDKKHKDKDKDKDHKKDKKHKDKYKDEDYKKDKKDKKKHKDKYRD